MNVEKRCIFIRIAHNDYSLHYILALLRCHGRGIAQMSRIENGADTYLRHRLFHQVSHSRSSLFPWFSSQFLGMECVHKGL